MCVRVCVCARHVMLCELYRHMHCYTPRLHTDTDLNPSLRSIHCSDGLETESVRRLERGYSELEVVAVNHTSKGSNHLLREVETQEKRVA